MTDRERLIELLDNFCKEELGTNFNKDILDKLADHLLANGVIVPPCKVGDVVYYVHETYWDKDYKKYIRTKSLKQNILQILERPDDKPNLMLEVIPFDYSNINEWLNGQIFLTKEEAEAKLKKCKKNERDKL